MRTPELCGQIAVVEDGHVLVVRLAGEIDSGVVAAYEAVPPPARVPALVDASAVTFLDGRGLCLLIRLAEGARRTGRTLVLRCPARPVQRLLDVAGVAGLFTVLR